MPRVWYLALGCLILGTPSFARADAAPPGLLECDGKSAGAACDGGVCRDSTCSRLDYEHPDPDLDGGPSTVQYDCVLCEAGSRDAGTSGPNTAVSSSESGCGSCSSTSHGGGDFGARAAALVFALSTGLWLGGWLRRPRR